MTRQLISIMILTVLSLSVNLSAAVIGSSDALSEHLQRAYESYLQGEAATTVGDKEQDFNRALRLFSQLEGEPGNGKLYYNIGNTYYQLEQYGWSILYYLRAQRLLPRDQKVQFLLTMAEAQQNLPITTENRWVSLFFFWHLKMSQVERIQAFMAFCVALLLFGSLFIWYRSGLLKIWTALSGIAASVLLVSILYFHYFAPVQAVIVNAFGLYHGPREDYALVSDEPFIPGTVVNVDRVVDDGTWLKVVTSDGKVGYVPSDVIRLI